VDGAKNWLVRRMKGATVVTVSWIAYSWMRDQRDESTGNRFIWTTPGDGGDGQLNSTGVCGNAVQGWTKPRGGPRVDAVRAGVQTKPPR
jgi:hypothetical protein